MSQDVSLQCLCGKKHIKRGFSLDLLLIHDYCILVQLESAFF